MPKDQDIYALKRGVADAIRRQNNRLYLSNVGVADVIARCLRHSRFDRAQHAQYVLHDLETFLNRERSTFSVNELGKAVERLERTNRPLYSWMAGLRLELVNRTVRDMTEGVYDLYGNRDDIVTRISVLALARPQYTSAPARMPRLFALNPAHPLRR